MAMSFKHFYSPLYYFIIYAEKNSIDIVIWFYRNVKKQDEL
jgi:hypothetical protein